jgi:hypothetical protein
MFVWGGDGTMKAKDFINQCKEKRTEHQEQVEVNDFCTRNKILMFAIPNGTNKSKVARTMFKNEGLKSGVPDLFIPIPSQDKHGLFIELKRRKRQLKNGKLSSTHTKVSLEQIKWLEALKCNGYEAVVCYGADEAIDVIKNYLECY